MSEIPYGYCHCGCGGKTTIAKWDVSKRGVVKGQPANYIHGHNQRNDIKTRFFAKITKTESCWTWNGYRDRSGYGQIKGSDSMKYSHRVSWEIHHGKIPKGLLVLHKCDNPPCCNPDHLFLGTDQDNMDDMISKGRGAKGSQNGQSKLTEAIVKIIRDDAGATLQRVLALRFGVSQTVISSALIRKCWRHI